MKETRMRSSYKTNAPKGWCGDMKRGVALGRSMILDVPHEFSGRLYLRHVPLNTGGYDRFGTYWGLGGRIYWAADVDGLVDVCVRALDRDGAKDQVRILRPHARFFR